MNQGIKRLFDRERPTETGDERYEVRRPSTSSFPSGHASAAAFNATVLTGLDGAIRNVATTYCSVTGAHGCHHHVSHRDGRAQFRQQSIEGRGWIIFEDADDSRSVRALVDKVGRGSAAIFDVAHELFSKTSRFREYPARPRYIEDPLRKAQPTPSVGLSAFFQEATRSLMKRVAN